MKGVGETTLFLIDGVNIMLDRESYICKQAVEVFGKDTQLLMYFEEAGELAQAIFKDKRGFKDKANIAEEIADVEIMLEQLKYIYKCHHAAEQFKAKKLIRLSARVDQRLRLSPPSDNF